ncbi:MAG: hypothetical protein Q7T16_04130 [Candidatus Burarchaeum sp.]|nr:hypothetical protein [Candidatus Burarchaeum sp.]MDO8339818.1 hypothetical protein [Candidatus Burarchaeum sp.]
MDEKYGYVLVFAAVVLVAAFFLGLKDKEPSGQYAEGTVAGPMHWHPRLSIYIDGERVRIPDDLGLAGTESPVHTHDEGDGTIHFEFGQGSIPRGMLTVGYFINDVWGKQFNSTCILDRCNGPGGRVKMLVNGAENAEFGHYVMHDDDVVEIRYG